MNALTPEKPDASSIASVDPTPWFRSRTSWAAAATVVTAVGGIVIAWVSPISLPEKVTATVAGISTALAGLSAIYARQGGVQSAAVAHEKASGIGPNA